MAKPSEHIVKDTDNLLEITVRDEAGALVDFSALSGAVAKVFQKGLVIEEFSLNTQAGFTDIIVISPGVIQLPIHSPSTKKAIVGKPYYYEIKTLAVNTAFSDNLERKSTGEIENGLVIDSQEKYKTFV